MCIALSAAAKTEMRLVLTVRSFSSLQDRCRAAVVRHLVNGTRSLDCLPIPVPIKLYISELIVSSSDPADELKSEPKSPAVAVAIKQLSNPRISLKFSAGGEGFGWFWPLAGWQGEISKVSKINLQWWILHKFFKI